MVGHGVIGGETSKKSLAVSYELLYKYQTQKHLGAFLAKGSWLRA